MNRTDVLIIGAGQAGLAMSCCLRRQGIGHVVLERGRIGERWRSERWDSLRLLTPNWMTRLPGRSYRGQDPAGFMHKDDVAALLESYGGQIEAPVETGVRVESVEWRGGGFAVSTDRGCWLAGSVVIATGACDSTRVPGWADGLPGNIAQVPADSYRRPEDIADGGVLVVGASATGVQLAEEIHSERRPVTLSVGRHVRLPRAYRGRDIMEWMSFAGMLDRAVAGNDPAWAMSQPSLQLIGRDGPSPDIARLAGMGVCIAGRARGASGRAVFFEDNLASECEGSEQRRHRVLERIDAAIAKHRINVPEDGNAWAVPEFPVTGAECIDLKAAGIRTVVWATGYKRDYSWLKVPVLGETGELRHSGGVTVCPGLYALGLPMMRRRDSTFLNGVGKDAADVSGEISKLFKHIAAKAA